MTRRHLVAVSFLLGSRLGVAQCPEGTPPPCAGARARRPPDPRAVAILPFRVTGADTSLSEGVAELLALEFTGEGGPRAVDQGGVLRAWRRAGGRPHAALTEAQATRIASQLGAGRLLTGAVVGAGGRVALSASILAVGDTGRVSARADGPGDSLMYLVPRLATGLLAGSVLTAHGGAPITQSSAALREYLAGLPVYRRGNYVEASRHFERALDLDSTFAFAAYELSNAYSWLDAHGEQRARAGRLAWAGRAKLGARERLMVEADAGPRYPAYTPLPERLPLLERATAAASDNPEAWYNLGDWVFHEGDFYGLRDASERATAAFRTALALDSTFVAPLSHLIQLDAVAGNQAELRHLGAVFLRVDPSGGGPSALATRLLLGHALGDSAIVHDARRRAEANPADAWLAPYMAIIGGIGVSDVTRMSDLVLGSAVTDDERANVRSARSMFAMNLGHWRSELEEKDRWARLSGDSVTRDGGVLRSALGSEGPDSIAAAAGAAASRLESVLADTARDAHRPASELVATCLVGRWQVARGQIARAAAVATRLGAAAAARAAERVSDALILCRVLLEAEVAVRRGDTDARQRVESADSLAHSDTRWAQVPLFPNLSIARLFEALGDPHRAYAAVLRGYPSGGDFDHALVSRERGRLGALVGDTATAIRSYRYYLALRADPDPELIPQRDSVRAELARLERRP